MDVARPRSVSALLSHSSANTRVRTPFIGVSAECVVQTPGGFLFSLQKLSCLAGFGSYGSLCASFITPWR